MKLAYFKHACAAAFIVLCSINANAQSPGAKIVASKTVATTDDASFNFFSASQGATKYRWLTGDGAVVDENNLNWEYSDIGYYKVSLIAYKGQQSDTSFVSITVLRGANYGNRIVDVTNGKSQPTLSENSGCDD